jgi:hypothetical protein
MQMFYQGNCRKMYMVTLPAHGSLLVTRSERVSCGTDPWPGTPLRQGDIFLQLPVHPMYGKIFKQLGIYCGRIWKSDQFLAIFFKNFE